MNDPRTLTNNDLLQHYRSALSRANAIEQEINGKRAEVKAKFKKQKRITTIVRIALVVVAVVVGLSLLLENNILGGILSAVIIGIVGWFGAGFYKKMLGKKETAAHKELNAIKSNMLGTAAQEFNLPASCFYLKALNYLVSVVAGGRADTYKESMNLLEQQKHNWKMEEEATLSRMASEETARSAARAADSAASAARSTAETSEYTKKIYNEIKD